MAFMQILPEGAAQTGLTHKLQREQITPLKFPAAWPPALS
jgi:hypothetical protein